jgi:Fic family protein
VDLELFTNDRTGKLVPIQGTDPQTGSWEHYSFLADPLTDQEPSLSPGTYRAVSRARAALASLDSLARQLPNPSLLRQQSLRREAQSTSALEGTYAPLDQVLAEDEEAPSSTDLREIVNYVAMADQAFDWLADGRPVTIGLLRDLQRTLMAGTANEGPDSGTLRNRQVVIGLRADALPGEPAVKAARFIPAPPGLDLEARLQDLLTWMAADHTRDIDPVVAAAMAHYQFESLHPFHDGNGRLGRLLIVLHLLMSGTLTEPTLTVSPWFEARRREYYDRLLLVSARGAWDEWIDFFSRGLESAALDTKAKMLALLEVQRQLREQVSASTLRSESAQKLVDLAIARPSFTVRVVARELKLSYARANGLIGQLCDLGILAPTSQQATYARRFHAPQVVAVLLQH